MKWIYCFILITALWSCRSVKYIPVESSADSIVVEKLVEVQLPPDSATIRALLECDENGKVVLSWLDIANSKNAQAQLTIDSGWAFGIIIAFALIIVGWLIYKSRKK